jgi:hypothetical protein
VSTVNCVSWDVFSHFQELLLRTHGVQCVCVHSVINIWPLGDLLKVLAIPDFACARVSVHFDELHCEGVSLQKLPTIPTQHTKQSFIRESILLHV